MKKRIRLIFYLVLVMVLFMNSTQIFASDELWTQAYIINLMEKQERAVAANDCINDGMGYNIDGTIDYEDDFAGAIIEDDKLIIYTIDCSEDNKNKYKKWAGEYSDAVDFKVAEYSYNYLVEKAPKVLNSLYETVGCSELSYYVSEANNNIVVLMDEETLNIIERQRNTIKCDVPVTYQIQDSNELTATNVTGGSVLTNASTGKSISVGCCGYYRGVRSIATCGHGNSGVGNSLWIGSGSAGAVGTITYHNFNNGRNGDYAIISDSNSNANYNFTNKIGSTYRITGTVTSPAVNTYVYFYGGATKSYGLGQVAERGVTFNVTYNGQNVSIGGLSTILVASGNAASGDSGGTVFTVNSGTTNAKFGGVMIGTSTASGSLVIYFTPAAYFTTLGFSVMTS